MYVIVLLLYLSRWMVLDWQLNLGWSTSLQKDAFAQTTTFLLVAMLGTRLTDRYAIGSQYEVYGNCSDSIQSMSIEISNLSLGRWRSFVKWEP